jgi:glyoxylase-like metal-dependent hydrolase (beta-lactamase superfamily II)
MGMTWLRFFTSILVLPALWYPGVQASDFDYPLDRITDKIQVIYGPLGPPDRRNHGFRNNVVIVSTTKGLVIFDPGGSAYAGEMSARKMKTVTQIPIVAVFNSHVHGDHWLGNEGIKKLYPDAVIYAHPTMKARIEGADGEYWLETINRLTEGTAGGKRVVGPDQTVDDGDVVEIGDTSFRIYHTGPAHTDNDIMIEVVDENALFTGDVVRDGLLGLMEEDASIKGNVAAIDLIVKKKFKYYIPGHGRAGGIEVPENYRVYLDTLRNTVKKLYAQELADFEMKPKVINAVRAYEKWANFELRIGSHISRAYLEIEAEEFE